MKADALARAGAATATDDIALKATLAKGTDITGFNDLDAAGVRTAVGLAAANLDTQLAAIAGFIDTEVAAILAAVDTAIAAIKAKTDSLTFTVAGLVDSNPQRLVGDATAATNLRDSAKVAYVGTVTGVATTTTLIDAGLTQADTDHRKGRIVIFLTGSLKYQATDITAFDPATDKLTFTALTNKVTCTFRRL